MSESSTSRPIALVTGCSGGIGGATALRFAKRGFDLFLAYGRNQAGARQIADGCRELGGAVELCAVDLTDRQRVEHLVTACLERFTSVHALVHCAGIAQEALLSTLDDATIDQLIAVHVTSTIALARAVIRPMLLQRQGRIVLLSSVAAHQPSQGATVYAGCKAFIEGFVRALAVEVGRKGITVNAVAPGMVDTNMLSPTRTLVGSRLAERAAAKRFAAPDEVAAAIEYLCGSDSAYVNGHVLAVDGAYLGPP